MKYTLLRDNAEFQRMPSYGPYLDYWQMLLGMMDSALGPRLDHEITPEECVARGYGEWKRVVDPPPPNMAPVFLNGRYKNEFGTFENAVLPAWYDGEYDEFDCINGVFDLPKQFLEIPFIPDVWKEAKRLCAKKSPDLWKSIASPVRLVK